MGCLKVQNETNTIQKDILYWDIYNEDLIHFLKVNYCNFLVLRQYTKCYSHIKTHYDLYNYSNSLDLYLHDHILRNKSLLDNSSQFFLSLKTLHHIFFFNNNYSL